MGSSDQNQHNHLHTETQITHTHCTESRVGLTQHGGEGAEVLDGQQRIRQLSDEQLQEAGRVVLFETLPREHAFVKLVFQLMTDGLGNNKHISVTS